MEFAIYIIRRKLKLGISSFDTIHACLVVLLHLIYVSSPHKVSVELLFTFIKANKRSIKPTDVFRSLSLPPGIRSQQKILADKDSQRNEKSCLQENIVLLGTWRHNWGLIKAWNLCEGALLQEK